MTTWRQLAKEAYPTVDQILEEVREKPDAPVAYPLDDRFYDLGFAALRAENHRISETYRKARLGHKA